MINEYCGVVNYKNEIQHHGIKGQKWGVRRFQNEDGTYTNAGAARRKQGTAKKKPAVVKKTAKKQSVLSKVADSVKTRTLRLKPVRTIAKLTMSDAELEQRIKRLRMEKDYNELIKSQQSQSSINSGKEFVIKTLKGFGKSVGIIKDAAVRGLANGLSKKIENALSATPEKKKEETNSTEIFKDLVKGKRKASDLNDKEFDSLRKRYGAEVAGNQRALEATISEEKRYQDWLKDRKELHHAL